MDSCVFCGMIQGSVSYHKVWEDEQHLAFLSVRPNTEGVTVVIAKEHLSSYFVDLSDEQLSKLIMASKKVARLLDTAFDDVGRTALVFEGFGIDHIHAKLYPLHGTKSNEWKQIESKIDKYFEHYEGYVSSHDVNKQADSTKLAELAEKIRQAQT